MGRVSIQIHKWRATRVTHAATLAVAVLAALVFVGAAAPGAHAQAAEGSLELVVDLTTGQARIVGNDDGPVALTGYEIFSESGSLVPGNWNSLDDQGRPGWEEAVEVPDAFYLSETLAIGTTPELIGSQGLPNLGAIFAPAGVRVLDFGFLVDVEGPDDEQRIGTVNFVSSVPEPASAGLLAAATALALARRRRR